MPTGEQRTNDPDLRASIERHADVRSARGAPPRRRSRLLLIAAAVIVRGVVAHAQGASERDWYVAVGAGRHVVDPVESDFMMASAPVRLDPGHVTFPHVAVGRDVGRFGFEVGYRKLGVLQFRTADGAVRGNTHSNAIEASGHFRLFELGPLGIRASAGVQVVRTIATLQATTAAWPVAGGINTWRVVPLVGLGARMRVADRWAVDVEYARILGPLGTARDSGRYRQQVVGVDLVRRW